jgi:hypothetical protein
MYSDESLLDIMWIELGLFGGMESPRGPEVFPHRDFYNKEDNDTRVLAEFGLDLETGKIYRK